MSFHPPFCPRADCAQHRPQGIFPYKRHGHYRRKCDGAVVQRFACKTCGHRFSQQSFRFNFRWWRPHVHLELAWLFASKCTMRQAARKTGLARETIARRMRAMGAQAKAFHETRLREAAGRLTGSFQLDEAETFETDRLVRPVTLPVLIHRHSLFVVHLETAPLPPRGRLDAFRQLRKERDERLYGKRRSGSRVAVESTLARIGPLVPAGEYVHLETDRKSSYRRLMRQLYGDRFGHHVQESSKTRRTRENVLFPINHTLAMLRDGVSRLVRRSWAASKLRARLENHLWIWVAYRNYVRGVTNEAPRVTPAMSCGVVPRQLAAREVYRWRWPERVAL